MTTTGRNRVLQLPVETDEMYGSFSPDRSRLLTGGSRNHARRPKATPQPELCPNQHLSHFHFLQPIGALQDFAGLAAIGRTDDAIALHHI